MSLRIFNTLSRAVSDFSPAEPGHVRMYVCGMTVYDLCHLGHARSMIAFDVVQRWLKASGFKVTYVAMSPTSMTRSSNAHCKTAKPFAT